MGSISKDQQTKAKQQLISKNYNQNRGSLSLTIFLFDTGRKSIGDKGFNIILKKYSNRIKYLYLEDCGITYSGIHQTINYWMQNLTTLHLGTNYIGSYGIKSLIKARLPHLSELRIDGCQIGDEGRRHLSKAKWPNLTTLWLRKGWIFINGLVYSRQNLNGCEIIPENQWRQLQKIYTFQFNPINFYSYLLMESSKTKVNSLCLVSSNKKMRQQIYRILRDKDIYSN